MTNELTLATSIALSGMFIGHALGFMITPKIVLGPIETYGNSGKYPDDWANPARNKSSAAIHEVGYQIGAVINFPKISCLGF